MELKLYIIVNNLIIRFASIFFSAAFMIFDRLSLLSFSPRFKKIISSSRVCESIIPVDLPIEIAVFGLSPVIIQILIPHFRKYYDN